MATAAEVDLAFRFLLGRPPTPAEALDWAAASIEALRPRLMQTEAFQAALPADAVLMPLELPPPPVAWQVDEPTAAALLARVQARWVALGQARPHWSMDMRPEFTPDQIEANRARFDASGDAEAASLLAVLARYGFTPETLPRLCDFGCGVGRMTRPFATRFASVLGCDISPPHLALARDASGPRARFALVEVPDFGMTEPFDLWFSVLTLQHNPPPVIAMILRRMFALLAPGGVAVFQLPTERLGYRFDPAEYLRAPDAPETMEIHVLPQSVVFALAAGGGCVPLAVREDGLVWPPTICLSNRFVFYKPGAAGPPIPP